MECVIAVEFLRAQNGETVAKEVAIVSKSCMQTHHFKSPYPNYYYSGSEDIGINWDDGFIPYSELFTVLDESTKISPMYTATVPTRAISYKTCYKSRFTIFRHSCAQNPISYIPTTLAT